MKKLISTICFMILCSVGVANADLTVNVSQDVTLESVGGSYTGTGMYAGYSASYCIEDAPLLFNLSGIPAGQTITSVTLNFDAYSAPSSDDTLAISSNPNTNWTRSSATYSNFGVGNNSLINTISSPVAGWQSVDVTNYVNSQLAAGNSAVTFVVGTTDAATLAANQSTTNAYYNIESSKYDSGAYESYLTVQTEAAPTPIPGAVWLFGSGLAGLVGMRKKIG